MFISRPPSAVFDSHPWQKSFSQQPCPAHIVLFYYSWWVCSFLASCECHNIPVLISFICGLGPSLAQVQLSHRACPSSSSSLIHSDVTIQCLWNIAMAVSQTSLTLHHGVNQAREGYKKGELLFICRHYRNQARWEPTWKALTRCLMHHLWVFPSGYLEQQETSPPAHQAPHTALFLGSLWKNEQKTGSNKHKSHWAWLSIGSSSDGGRLWEQEGSVLLDSWLSCFMVFGSERLVSI